MRVGDDELEPPRRAGPDVVEDQPWGGVTGAGRRR